MLIFSLVLAFGAAVGALPSDVQQIFGLEDLSGCKLLCPPELIEPGSRLVSNTTSTTGALACMYWTAGKALGLCHYSKVSSSFLHCAWLYRILIKDLERWQAVP
jgi:hypothetical protein